jgi:hypothetical protein
VHPGNSWDLKAGEQKAGETLREYIHHFSKQYNELPNIVNADVIRVFISSTTNEALIQELRSSKPQTTREILDLTTSHASDEEAVQAIFCKYKGKAQAEPMDEANDCNR